MSDSSRYGVFFYRGSDEAEVSIDSVGATHNSWWLIGIGTPRTGWMPHCSSSCSWSPSIWKYGIKSADFGAFL